MGSVFECESWKWLLVAIAILDRYGDAKENKEKILKKKSTNEDIKQSRGSKTLSNIGEFVGTRGKWQRSWWSSMNKMVNNEDERPSSLSQSLEKEASTFSTNDFT